MKLHTAMAVAAMTLLVVVPAEPAMALRALPTYTAVPLDSPQPQAQSDDGPGGRFGQTLDPVGDIDGDGATDVAIAANNQNVGSNNAAGRAWIFSGRTRAVLRTLEHPDPQVFSLFGSSMIGIADLNGGASQT